LQTGFRDGRQNAILEEKMKILNAAVLARFDAIWNCHVTGLHAV
jgi:hypothetical protein